MKKSRAKRFRVAWHTFHEGSQHVDGTRRQLRPVIARLQKEGTPFVVNDENGNTVAGGRNRAKNPRMQNMFVIYATRAGTTLKYIGGNRFSSTGRAVLYPSRAAATYEARELKSKYATALRGYTLRIHS